MAETGLTKQQIITQLTRSEHGKLDEYMPLAQKSAKQEPEFFSHLIAWNHKHGVIRDSKIALPMAMLRKSAAVLGVDATYEENALAHIALLGPRELDRAIRFAKGQKVGGRKLTKLAGMYLREIEDRGHRKWERAALQHRSVMKSLYAMNHIKPSDYADAVLFKGKYPKASLFAVVATLKTMSDSDAASAIIQHKLPFLVVQGALGNLKDRTDLVFAMIERMSPTELVTNTKMLEKLGVKTNPALRGAYTAALERASKSNKATFKTTVAAQAVGDKDLSTKLKVVQERQLDKMSIEGNWLVLADRSPSMEPAIDASRHLAATLARMGAGDVHLLFFDGGVHKYLNVTGKTYDEILSLTKGMRAGGSGTSIGAGVRYAMEKGLDVDGIAIVSDGGENHAPQFPLIYPKYCDQIGKEVPVYLYLLKGSSRDVLTPNMHHCGLEMQTFDMRNGFDYHSLPNVVKTMRTKRYGLIDEIMETPLLALGDVFNSKRQRSIA